jgi:hypothetical protein
MRALEIYPFWNVEPDPEGELEYLLYHFDTLRSFIQRTVLAGSGLLLNLQ